MSVLSQKTYVHNTLYLRVHNDNNVIVLSGCIKLFILYILLYVIFSKFPLSKRFLFMWLQVDDQMKLLQHSWSDMLVLDHIHQHMHNNLANEIMLHNGQKFDLLALGLLGVTTMADCFARVIDRLQELKFDVGDYICLKFLLLLNPGKYLLYDGIQYIFFRQNGFLKFYFCHPSTDVKGIGNSKHVHEGHEQVLKALLEYCITANSQVQVN